MTRAEAGLPGREKIGFDGCVRSRSEGEDEETGNGIVAKVVGLPGFIETRPKWIVPLRLCSMVGFMRSSSPMDAPPVVTRTSALVRAAWRADSKSLELENGRIVSDGVTGDGRLIEYILVFHNP